MIQSFSIMPALSCQLYRASERRSEETPVGRLREPDRLRIGKRDDAKLVRRKEIDRGRVAGTECSGVTPAHAPLVIVVDIPS